MTQWNSKEKKMSFSSSVTMHTSQQPQTQTMTRKRSIDLALLIISQMGRQAIYKSEPTDIAKLALTVVSYIDQWPGGMNATVFPLANKVSQSIRNFHLRITDTQSGHGIKFSSIPPGNKTWQIETELELPSSDSPFMCRSNGTIAYAFVNTVTTWDWQNNQQESIAFPTQITALAELRNGTLVVGDTKGCVWVNGHEPIDLETESPIEKIYAVDAKHFVTEFENQESKLVNWDSRKVIRTFTEDMYVQFFEEELLVIEQKGTILVENVSQEKSIYKYPKTGKVIGSGSGCLLVKDEGRVVIWDVYANGFQCIDAKNIAPAGNIVLDDQTAILKQIGNSSLPLLYCSGDTEVAELENRGCWSVTATALLSDGSIIYGTDTRGSKICIVTQKGEVVFENQAITSDGDRNVNSLTELRNGSVVVDLGGLIRIIKPQTKKASSIQYKIEKLKLELRYTPDRLDLYQELAKRYEEVEARDSCYRTYLAGLSAAVKSGDLYKARRFYEKARRVYPNRLEPIELFLSHLKPTHYKKLRKRIVLDKHSLLKKCFGEMGPWKKRKYKERLFIGDGDFSYSEAFIKKHAATHPELAKSITATELLEPTGTTIKTIQFLLSQGMTVLFGIDAQKIHQAFPRKRFKRIHWNCPFGDASQDARDKFKEVVPVFFQSCHQMQLPMDRVHVTLMQSEGYSYIRQQENPIVLGSTLAGYRLIRKRRFGSQRYPGYEHVKTRRTTKYDGGGEEREFVFEKLNPLALPSKVEEWISALKDSRQKEYQIEQAEEKEEDLGKAYFTCSTDEDSSDYYSSDEELSDHTMPASKKKAN